ncbi:hypothetical protein [uncultured Dysosmobacter sp.]|uniref:hypothetical protein n=1 Tax=uncultured Dysosmobacter sp. TaxID=2591384 RepID=UPI002621A34B|nr:hypothetical protein [uncultured Dysosmobacter sp.]
MGRIYLPALGTDTVPHRLRPAALLSVSIPLTSFNDPNKKPVPPLKRQYGHPNALALHRSSFSITRR